MFAGLADRRLGIKTKGKPPQKVLVRKVKPGTLAEFAGVAIGHEITAINGRAIEEMTHSELVDLTLNVRPLELAVVGVPRRPVLSPRPQVASTDMPSSESSEDSSEESRSASGKPTGRTLEALALDAGKMGRRFAELRAAWSKHRLESAQRTPPLPDAVGSAGQATPGDVASVEAFPAPGLAVGISRAMLQGALQELDVLEGWLVRKLEEDEQHEALAQKADAREDHTFHVGAFDAFSKQSDAVAEPVLDDATGGTPLASVGQPSSFNFDVEMRRLRDEVRRLEGRARREMGHTPREHPAQPAVSESHSVQLAAVPGSNPWTPRPDLWLI